MENREEKEIAMTMYENYYTEKIPDKLKPIFTKHNPIAVILKVLGVFIIGGSIIAWSLVSIITEKIDLLLLLKYLFWGCLMSLGFFIVAEVIQIFHDIRFRLWMK